MVWPEEPQCQSCLSRRACCSYSLIAALLLVGICIPVILSLQWSYPSTTVCIISLHMSTKIWINHIIRNIGDINISMLAAPSILAAALIRFVLAFLVLSMVRTSCLFYVIYSMKYLATPQKGYPIGAAMTMVPVITILAVHRRARPRNTDVQ